MPIIIFCRKSVWQYILFWYKKYISSNSRAIRNAIVADDNCKVDAPEYRLADYKASEIENRVIDDLINRDSLKYIGDFYDESYYKYTLGERILFESRKIFHSYIYTQKIIRHYNINSSIYIWPLDFDIKIFSIIKKYNILPNNIELHPIAKIYLYLKYVLKYIYFLSKTIFYIEYKILTAKFSYKKKNFRYCIQMDDGLLGYDLTPDQLIIDEKVNHKKEVIFTGIKFNNTAWVDVFTSKGFNVCNIHKSITLLFNVKYIKYFYKKFFLLKFRVIKSIINNPSLASNLFNRYKNEIIWDSFYSVHNIDKIISIMIADNVTASTIHKKNGVKSYFVFLSNTESILEGIKRIIFSEVHDYTHMMYDFFIGSRFSINHVKSLDSKINKYIEIDPILSDIIINNSNQSFKEKTLERLLGHNYDNRLKIISILDTSIGEKGVMNHNSYKIFLRSLKDLSSMYPQTLLLFKTKKSLSYIRSIGLGSHINEILKSDNIKYANDYGMSSYEAMSIADIIVSGPESSVIYESLYAGKKTICYDPLGRYRNYKSLSHILPKCSAYNHDQFLDLIIYWSNISEHDHKEYILEYVQKFFSSKIGSGRNVQKLRESIHFESI